jgi:hypothetical protein
MTTRYRFSLGAGAVLVVILAFLGWKVARPVEPTYEGKPLKDWLEGHVASSSANPPYNSASWHKADTALRHIGTNAIPTLLNMIRAKDSPLKLKLLDWSRKQRVVKIRYRYALPQNEEAEYAFETLGTNAASAVPGLIKIYQDAVSRESQRCSARALGYIGRPAQAALPALFKNLTHTNGDVRFDAVSAVYGIGGEPNVVVPALRSLLKDPMINVRWNAVAALRNFESRARSAVPELLQALEDPANIGNNTLREQIETALWQIAPEKTSKTMVVEEATQMVVDNVTTEPLDLLFNGERNTLIRPGKAVPCVAACWNNEPRGLLTYYRGTHCLGQFEVVGLPPPSTAVNAQVLCVIADQQIVLCARDYTRKVFLEVRRIGNGSSK